MNSVDLIGRLTKDPELKYTPGKGTAVTSITIAVDKFNTATNQKEADFIQVIIWGKQAESTAQYMTKGSLMGVRGRIQTRSYDDKNGTRRYATEVIANEMQFLSKSKPNTNQSGPNYDNMTFNDDMQEINDGDIPF